MLRILINKQIWLILECFYVFLWMCYRRLEFAPDVLKAMYDQAVMFKAFNH